MALEYSNKWLSSYETLRFNTVDGDLGIDQYALDETGVGYYVRTKSKDESQFEYVESSHNITGLEKVELVIGEHCYYDEFRDAKGETVRIQTTGKKYWDITRIKNYPQPKRTELVDELPNFPEPPMGDGPNSIAFDAASNSGKKTAVSSYSWSHTCTGGNRLLVVGDGHSSSADRTVTGITYNSDPMASVRSDLGEEGSLNFRSTLYYLIAPDTGSNTVAVTLSDTIGQAAGGAISYTGAKQSSQPDAHNGGKADSTTPTINVTTSADNSWVVSTVVGYVAGSGQTFTCDNSERWSVNIDSSYRAAGGSDTNGPKTPAGSQTMSWGNGYGNGIEWAISAASFAPATASGVDVTGTPATIAAAAPGSAMVYGTAVTATAKAIPAVAPTAAMTYGMAIGSSPVVVITITAVVPTVSVGGFMRTLYPTQDAGPTNWSAASWSLADDNAKNQPKPVSGDMVIFTANSGGITLDENSAELAALTMTGYSSALGMGVNSIAVDGAVALAGTITASNGSEIECSGNFSAADILPDNLIVTLDGTGNVTTVSASAAALIINTAGTHTAASTQFWDSFTLTGGTYVDGGDAHTIAGSIILSADTFTSTGTWTMTAEGELNSGGKIFAELIVGAGATFDATMTGDVRFKKATLAAEVTLKGAFWFRAQNPPANNFLNMLGEVDGNAKVRIFSPGGGSSNNGRIVANAFELFANNQNFTQSGTMTVVSTKIYGTTNNQWAKLIIGGSGSSLGAVSIGTASGTNLGGRLDLGDGNYTVAIASLVNLVTAGDPPTLNELDFGNAVIVISGNLNAANITCSASSTPIISGSGGSAAIINVNLGSSNYLDARAIFGDSISDSGGNTNVRFARGLVGGGTF